MQVIKQSNISTFPMIARGKVRDMYEIDEQTLLIVTTDRMSAFDVIMREPVPYKGVILNKITLFWMERFKDIVPNHLIESDVNKFPKELEQWADELEGRSVLVKKAKPLPVECIVRGHLTGSGWKDYKSSGSLCGYKLPENLKESAKLEPALFTPSTKAELGEHDENITVEQAKKLLGAQIAAKVEDISLRIFEAGRSYAQTRGILMADTKFEFGMVGDELILIDEVMTPDSSRFWPLDQYEEGRAQPSFDKQYLRDWLMAQVWDKTPPAPVLPQDVIDATAEKYAEAYKILTGTSFDA